MGGGVLEQLPTTLDLFYIQPVRQVSIHTSSYEMDTVKQAVEAVTGGIEQTNLNAKSQ